MDEITSNDDSYTETSSDELAKLPGLHKCTYEGCKAKFRRPSRLQYHIRRHTGERPFACDEPNCSKTYLFSFHLRRHKDVHHKKSTSAQSIACTHPGCHVQLANKYSLKKHLSRKHNADRYPYNCGQCTQGFLKKRLLAKHNYEHTGELPYSCDVCEARFISQHACNRHKRTHTKYTCDCKADFERWSDLLKHKRSCATQELKCTVCNKRIKGKSNLKIHMSKRHTAPGKQQFFACTYENCNRSYLYKKNLAHHINFYHKKTALPQISCTHPGCNRTFSQTQTLKNHMKVIHSPQVPKPKKLRKPRKDKGIGKECMASVLTGVVLSTKEHRSVIVSGRDVRSDSDSESEAPEAVSTNVQNNVGARKEIDCAVDGVEIHAKGEGAPVTDVEGLRNLVHATLDMIGLSESYL